MLLYEVHTRSGQYFLIGIKAVQVADCLLRLVIDSSFYFFTAFETPLQEGLHFEGRMFHATFATVSFSFLA
jgi:hypothetical protein